MPLIIRHFKGMLKIDPAQTMDTWALNWRITIVEEEIKGNTLLVFRVPSSFKMDAIGDIEKMLQEKIKA